MTIPNLQKLNYAGENLTKILRTNQPLSLLDGIDRRTGMIIDPHHDLYGQSIAGVELYFPHSVGSTVGIMTLIELKEHNKAPSQIILEDPDTNVIAGCILANIPISIKNQPLKKLPS
ncbi:MAG: aconitase X swivel domain-containing protein, partial [Promethearchaeota archaeon]